MKTEKELLDNVLKSIEELRKFHQQRAEWCDKNIKELTNESKPTTISIDAVHSNDAHISQMKYMGEPCLNCGSDDHTLCGGIVYCTTCNEIHPVGGLVHGKSLSGGAIDLRSGSGGSEYLITTGANWSGFRK